MNQEKRFLRVPGLSLRSLIMAALGSILISVSSTYVALRMSALPWPTIFVTVLAMAILKLLGNTSINEINVTNTGMSAGAMVAGALAFTIPGLFISGIYEPFDPSKDTFRTWLMPKFWPVLAMAVFGVIAGSFICFFLRRRYLKRRDLPYPIGQAAAETLQAGDQGGKKAALLFGSLAISAIFTALRDYVRAIPENISSQIGALPIALYTSPMAIAIGYIIGFGPAAYWMLGNIIARIGFDVWGVHNGTFASAAEAGQFGLTAAIGLMVGSGIAILIASLRVRIKKNTSEQVSDQMTEQMTEETTEKERLPKRAGLIALILTALVFFISILAGLSPLVSILLMLGAWFASAMSAVITGQTGINPMEVFGIIVLLAIRLLLPVSNEHAFFIAAAIAVVCGYTGDMMNDYKSGQIVNTNPKAQLISELVGGLIGAVVAVAAFFAVIYQFGGVGGETGLTAAQAHSVAAMVSGIGDPVVFSVSLVLGTLLFLKGVPAMIIGIGMILPQGMSLAIFIGGLLSVIVPKLSKNRAQLRQDGQIIAAGLLGGEGITGTIIAFISMFTR